MGEVEPIWWTVQLRCIDHGVYQLEFDKPIDPTGLAVAVAHLARREAQGSTARKE
jgi:hypothetical protein